MSLCKVAKEILENLTFIRGAAEPPLLWGMQLEIKAAIISEGL